MAPQDDVRPVLEQEVRQLLLVSVLGQPVLQAPVDHHGDQVRVQGSGGLQVPGQTVPVRLGEGGQVVGVEDVEGVGVLFGQGDAVGAVGVAQEGHGDATHVRHDGIAVEFLLSPAGPHVAETRLVQHVQGPAEAGEAPVQAVVVGGEAEVETQGLQIMGHVVGGVEGGIAGVGRPAGEGGLQVDHGVVRRLHPRPGAGHDPGVVIPFPVPGVVGDGHVAHGVPADRQGGRGGFRRRGFLRRGGLRRGRGGRGVLNFPDRVRRRSGRGAAAAGAQQEQQAQREEKKPEFHGKTSLGPCFGGFRPDYKPAPGACQRKRRKDAKWGEALDKRASGLL